MRREKTRWLERSPGAVWAVVVTLLATQAADAIYDAAKAAEIFDGLFSDDVRRAKGTRDSRDDLEVAGRILEAAGRSADEPEFVRRACEAAYDLASTHREGYETAIEAMDLLSRHVPARAAACAEGVLAIRQKQFDGARGPERLVAGEALLDLVLPAAEAKVAALDLAEASSLYRQAATIARAAATVRRAEIEARCQWLTQATAALDEARRLEAVLGEKPADTASRDRLVRLYLADLDRPGDAAKHVEGLADASLRKYVPAAARPLEDAPALACLELGQWYVGLAEAAPRHAKDTLYSRAETYLERFLDIYPEEGLERTRAATALKKIETAYDTLDPRRWLDLLPRIDPKTHAAEGNWERQGKAVAIVRWAHYGRIMIPAILRGSYDLRTTFVRTTGDGIVGVALPVGSTDVLLVLSYQGSHGLGELDKRDAASNESTFRPGTLENGRPYDLRIAVRVEDTQAAIRVRLDGKAVIRWRGPQSALALGEYWRLPRRDCPGFVAYNSNVVFASAAVRTCSCRTLRPTAAGN